MRPDRTEILGWLIGRKLGIDLCTGWIHDKGGSVRFPPGHDIGHGGGFESHLLNP